MLKKRKLARCVRKDYQSKNLKNPFFRKNPKGRGWLFFRWVIASGLILIIFIGWLLFMSPWWRLQKLDISGLTRRQPADIESLIWQQTDERRGLFFKQSNLLLFDAEEARQSLINHYNFAGVKITKQLPRTLKINISERPYAFIFKEGESFSYSDASGYLITEAAVSEEDKSKYFILENSNPQSLVDQDQKLAIDQAYLEFTFSLYKYLINFPDLPLEKFIIDQEQHTLQAKFRAGPIALFKTSDEAVSQVDRLVLVKNDKIRDNFSRTNYIDLRYGSRVFINPEFPN